MDNAGATKPTFLWRGILILLPLLLLAGVGLYSLRQDRLLAEVEAGERCQNLAANFAATISERLLTTMARLADAQGLDAIMELDEHGEPLSINGMRERAMFPQDPTPHPLSDANLSPAQMAAWHESLQAEFARADASAAMRDWRKFIDLAPPAPFLTHAEYDLGLLLAAGHETTAAVKLFSDVEHDRSAVTDSGLPLCLLAEVQRVELGPRPIPIATYQSVVYHPTFTTPAILERMAKLDSTATGAIRSHTWLDRWRDDQETRDFYLHTRQEIAGHPMRRAFWTNWEGTPWLVLLVPSNGSQAKLLRFDRDIVTRVLQDTLTNGPPQPGYAQPGIEVAGKAILPADPHWPVLGKANAALFPEGANNSVIVYECLSQPALLYAQQRTRTIWFAAIILVSAMAALVGFVSAYRGFHQQLRLSEMKSNFVSSVSHELRAPIASVRLLAENLEGGKIPEPQRQKEYFSFIVQECRRLSSLVENVLDFSRIEQGRKQYEFEPANIVALTQTTVKLMEPYAAERGVQLEMSNDQKPTTNIELNVDSRAIQQALVNLIDNAIKHSARGQTVTVGIEMPNGPAAAIIRLFVADRGPGIPAAEHEKIFERFYRRGSELRRETQGVGIGLSIVKHIVQAHGGLVTVQSEPGAGSRFTIELPVRN